MDNNLELAINSIMPIILDKAFSSKEKFDFIKQLAEKFALQEAEKAFGAARLLRLGSETIDKYSNFNDYIKKNEI